MTESSTLKPITVTLACECKHSELFIIHENTGTPEQPAGDEGHFVSDEKKLNIDYGCGVVRRVSLDSYAYSNGGCCFRAAQDALHGRSVPPAMPRSRQDGKLPGN